MNTATRKFIFALTLFAFLFGSVTALGAEEDKVKVKSKKVKVKKKNTKKEGDKAGGGFLKSLDYPELQVVPRASDRIKMEAEAEKKNFWYVNWAFQMSALSTLYAGSSLSSNQKEDLSAVQKDEAATAVTTANTIGGLWLLGSIIYSFDKPYSRAANKIGKKKSKSKRSQLLKERLAEEALEEPAKLTKTLAYFSAATNFLASAYTGLYMGREGLTSSVIAGFSAFLPIIFDHRYSQNYDKHQEYKRKIYSPIVSMNLVPDKNNKMYSQLNFKWSF